MEGTFRKEEKARVIGRGEQAETATVAEPYRHATTWTSADRKIKT